MMRLMHTPIPSFYKQMEAAGKRVNPDTEVVVRGLENFQSAKLASLRVGRLENEVYEISQEEGTTKIEVIAAPYNPELFYIRIFPITVWGRHRLLRYWKKALQRRRSESGSNPVCGFASLAEAGESPTIFLW